MNKQKRWEDINDYVKDMTCVISEEWGEAVKALNDWRFGKGVIETAIIELTQTAYPLTELVVMLNKFKNGEPVNPMPPPDDSLDRTMTEAEKEK